MCALATRLAVLALLTATTAAQSTPAAASNETPAQRDARMQWWRDAHFGMFVHWGLYSGLAGTWDGKVVGTKGGMEWIQHYVKADTTSYAKAALPKFVPSADFAVQWAKLAKAAGCQYVVFTTKHHDGFALHDSKVTDFDAGSALGRDLVQEITTALRAEGLKVGFYHSVIDWHHDQYEYARSQQLPHPRREDAYAEGSRDHGKYLDHLFAQVGELLVHRPDIVWWDYSSIDFQGDAAWRATDLMQLVRERLPGVIMNNRLYRSREAGWASMGTDGYLPQLDPKFGDFITPEQHVPPSGMPGVDWETCMTMNTTWGYSDHDPAWKPAKELLQNLIDITAKGGNFLLNIGPRGDGSVPEPSVTALQTIGAWMQQNGEAILGTRPAFADLPFGRSTRRTLSPTRAKLYLHVFDKPADGRLVLPAADYIDGTCRLLTSGEALPVRTDAAGGGTAVVQLPASLVVELPVVVVIEHGLPQPAGR
jgi:alpha-L-fucosidase